jgi:predicted RNase H-like nuclease (RuvC/YqgF family)
MSKELQEQIDWLKADNEKRKAENEKLKAKRDDSGTSLDERISLDRRIVAIEESITANMSVIAALINSQDLGKFSPPVSVFFSYFLR